MNPSQADANSAPPQPGTAASPADSNVPVTAPIREVDARGLNCPLPILRTKKALATLQPGELIRVLATDPGSRRDFEAFARQTGNPLVQLSEAEGVFTFLMRRKG